jgi:hypothetical protein
MSRFLFVCCVQRLLSWLFLRSGSVAGGGPAATFFLCFAKKEGKRRRPRSRCPSGSRFVPRKKWETGETRLRSDNAHFSFHFLLGTNGSVRSGLTADPARFGFAGASVPSVRLRMHRILKANSG